MPTITLPDGAQRSYDDAVTGRVIAEDISKSLAKKAIGVTVDGDIRDLDTTITDDAAVAILTPDNEDENALFLMRHSCAHVMAEAICDLFPGTRLAYGPPVEEGFYYDLATPRPLTVDDFPAIEKRMQQIVNENRPFTRVECGGHAARARRQVQDRQCRARAGARRGCPVLLRHRHPRRELGGPVRRTARAGDGQAEGLLQDHVGGRRLLARRPHSSPRLTAGRGVR